MDRIIQAVIVAALVGVIHLPTSAQDNTKPAQTQADGPQKWVFLPGNFAKTEEVDRVIKTLQRAAKAGYTDALVGDSKFSRWNETKGTNYNANVQKVRQTCRDLKIRFYAGVCDQGAELLSNDPNLAEGMPVIDAPFVAKDGKLAAADEDCKIVSGGFEQVGRPNMPTGWWVDDPGKVCFVDNDVKYDGKPSIRIQDIKAGSSNGNGRINQAIKVKPFRYYHATIAIKTDNFDAPGTINVMALGKGPLNWQAWEIAKTQDWKKYDIVFNTLDNESITFYAGSWGGTTGKLYFADVTIEPGGLVNLIRRDSGPLKVTSADGKTVYEEGKDFAGAKDPKLGNTLFPGCYQIWYAGPTMTLPQGSRIKNGDAVLVSYDHAAIALGYGVFACMNEPKVMDLVKWQIQNVHKVLEPDGYMMSHDEIRVAGWDESCVKSGKTPAQTLADNVKQCVAIIKNEDPGKSIYVWNDMFDPNHNAAKTGNTYYLVKGIDPWYGSWEGLPKDVGILNWNGFDKVARLKTLKFFSDRGQRQILCGWYDRPGNIDEEWFKAASKIPGVRGAMYTTWANDFKDLENYSKGIDNNLKASGF
jgi:hypothetical protein